MNLGLLTPLVFESKKAVQKDISGLKKKFEFSDKNFVLKEAEETTWPKAAKDLSKGKTKYKGDYIGR